MYVSLQPIVRPYREMADAKHQKPPHKTYHCVVARNCATVDLLIGSSGLAVLVSELRKLNVKACLVVSAYMHIDSLLQLANL